MREGILVFKATHEVLAKCRSKTEERDQVVREFIGSDDVREWQVVTREGVAVFTWPHSIGSEKWAKVVKVLDGCRDWAGMEMKFDKLSRIAGPFIAIFFDHGWGVGQGRAGA